MENKKSIFRQESLDRIESPEQLDSFIRASKPSAWIILIAALIVVISVIVWGVVGEIPKVFNASGVSTEEKTVLCYVEPSQLPASCVGCKVNLTLPDNSVVSGEVSSISEFPYSGKEISEILGADWLVYNFIGDDPGKYMYQLEITPDEPIKPQYIVDASIITDTVRPIVYLLN